MKKIIACISLVFAMSAGVTALAATTAEPTTNETNNSVAVTPDAVYTTVLIEDSKDQIVYVNQADEGYTASAATNFLLKADAGYGTYTLKMGGGANGASTETTFEIAAPTPSTVDMGEATYEYVYASGEHKDLGFQLANRTDLAGLSKLTITATNENGDSDSVVISDAFTAITGDSAINVAVKIKRVPVGVTLAVSIDE